MPRHRCHHRHYRHRYQHCQRYRRCHTTNQVAIASEKYRQDPSVKSFEEQRAENKLARKKVGFQFR